MSEESYAASISKYEYSFKVLINGKDIFLSCKDAVVTFHSTIADESISKRYTYFSPILPSFS